jgi:hypothetical protein
LKATVSQRLLNRADGKGRVVAQEIMITNTAIAECIANPLRTSEIPIFIENSNTQLGSQTFHQHLSALFRAGTITLDVAKQASANASDFEQSLNYEKNETATGPEAGKVSAEDSESSLLRKSVSLQLEKQDPPPVVEEPFIAAPEEKSGIFRKVLRSVKKAS